MTWKYSIVKEDDYYTIREVITSDDTGLMWTMDEIAPSGESRDELRHVLTMYIQDIVNSPILIVKDDEVIGEEAPLVELLDDEVLVETESE